MSLYEYELTIPTLWNAVKGKRTCRRSFLYRFHVKSILSEFILAYPDLVSPDNAMAFLSDDNGQTYNRCHCKSLPVYSPFSHQNSHSFLALVWSNFEIGNLDLWRSEAYGKFFDFLDQKGGFYYEVCFAFACTGAVIFYSRTRKQRWGDAPVHSIGAALFARKDQIVCHAVHLLYQGLIHALVPLIAALLQRYRLSSRAIPALSSRRCPQEREMLV